MFKKDCARNIMIMFFCFQRKRRAAIEQGNILKKIKQKVGWMAFPSYDVILLVYSTSVLHEIGVHSVQ